LIRLAICSCLICLSVERSTADEGLTDDQTLQNFVLGVIMNERSTGVQASFKRRRDGRFAATPGDLQTAGIRPSVGVIGSDGLIDLDTLNGVQWQYDDVNQIIRITAPDNARIPLRIDLRPLDKPADFSAVRSSPSFVLNYSLYAASGWGAGSHKAFSGSFDARFVSSVGVISSSAFARFDPAFSKIDELATGVTRLDSSWRYTDPVNALVYQLGDGVSGGLSGTSSWRFGGFQFRRNFDIRSDLVTAPVPNLSGTTSVPSTLDLYLNNIKIYSGDVPAGPFDFSGIPYISNGDAVLVLHDALGRETRTRQAYYFGAEMLAKDYFDFSTELGFPRLRYGQASFDYDHDIAGAASVRYGMTDWLTLTGHLEATRGLINGGLGFSTSLGQIGNLNVSALLSHYKADQSAEKGGRVSFSYMTGYNGYLLYANSSRSFGDYNDVGLIVDRRHDALSPVSARAKSIDSIGLSFPLSFDPSSVSVNYSRIRGAGKDGNASLINIAWTRTVFTTASLYVTGYTNLDRHKDFGFFAGLSVPLDRNMTASVNASKDGIETSLTKSALLGQDPISWSLRDRETIKGHGSRSASIKYHSSVGEVSASVDQSQDQGRVTSTLDGALVIAGGGIFFVNRVNDGFAVVKGGGPNLPVSLNGRQVATTNYAGRAFLPDLQSFQYNTVAIDPANLPLDLQPETTQSIVMPADHSGVTVDFRAEKANGATIVLTDTRGNALPVGSEVRLDASGNAFVLGYDGRVWLTGLSADNSLTVTLPEGAGICHARFNYRPVEGNLPEISDVKCLDNGEK
jgi:outer membrane usher protein